MKKAGKATSLVKDKVKALAGKAFAMAKAKGMAMAKSGGSCLHL